MPCLSLPCLSFSSLPGLSELCCGCCLGQAGLWEQQGWFKGKEMGLVHSTGTDICKKNSWIASRQNSLILCQTLKWTHTYRHLYPINIFKHLKFGKKEKEKGGGEKEGESKGQVCVWTWCLSTCHLDPATALTHLKVQCWINGGKPPCYLCLSFMGVLILLGCFTEP